MFGSRKTTGRDQHARNRTDRGRHPPSECHHPADPNADQTRRFRIDGGCPHGQSDPSEAEEQEQEDQQDEGHTEHPRVMGADGRALEQGLRAERRREGLDGEIPDEARRTVEDAEQRDEDDDMAQDRRIVQRPKHDPLDGDPGNEGQRESEDKRRPVGHAPFDQLPGDEGGEHRHLALGQIEMMDSLVDHHDGKSDAGNRMPPVASPARTWWMKSSHTTAP